MIIYLYDNNFIKKHLSSTEEIYLINLESKNIDWPSKKIIPFFNSYLSTEISCLESTYLYFKKQEVFDKYLNFKIENTNIPEKELQFFCINSFKKRKFLYKNINLKIDPENFKIKISNIPNLINFFNFFIKTNLINQNKYFFGFLLNFYFSTVDKE